MAFTHYHAQQRGLDSTIPNSAPRTETLSSLLSLLSHLAGDRTRVLAKRKCTYVRVCVCVGVCGCGCVGVWGCGCVGVWVCG